MFRFSERMVDNFIKDSKIWAKNVWDIKAVSFKKVFCFGFIIISLWNLVLKWDWGKETIK